MSEANLPDLCPKDIQALWLVLKEAVQMSDSSLVTIARTILHPADFTEVSELLQVGEQLGLIENTEDSQVPTQDGKTLGTARHWRLWEPAPRVKALAELHGISHFFIDPETYDKRPVIIDLFAGVGGLSLGFAIAGFDVALAVDNDPQACEAHALNFPDTVVLSEDVSSFAENTSTYLEQIDRDKRNRIVGVVGGPPCQGFSYIGERKTGDDRNLLTDRFIDVVLTLQPEFFVMENVPGLLTSGRVPSFPVYLIGLGKSNGEAATHLTTLLPPVPKIPPKRNRQFRQKLVNSTIRTFWAATKCYLQQRLEATFEPKESFTCLRSNLRQLLKEAILTAYNDRATAEEVLARGSEPICTITLAIMLEHLMKCKLVKRDACRSYFLGIGARFPGEDDVAAVIESIDAKYDSLPPDKAFEGKQIGPVLARLLERVEETYDVAKPQVLNAASFGTPQSRERLFIVGIRKDKERSFQYPLPSHGEVNDGLKSFQTTQQAIGDLPDIDSMPNLLFEHTFPSRHLTREASDFARRMRLEQLDRCDLSLPRATWNSFEVDCSKRTIHDDHIVKRLVALAPGKQDKISRKVRLHPDRPAPTIRAGTKANKGSHTAVRPVHYKYHRVISVREGARLMGYPDWMTLHETKWHGFRLVGNGVPVPLSTAIAREIRELLYKPL